MKKKNFQKKSIEELKEERESLLNQSNEFLGSLVDAIMDEANVEKVNDYFKLRAQCNNYSNNNFALILSEDIYRHGEITVSKLAPFHYWTKLKNEAGEKASIKKGSRGFPVLVPVHVTRYEIDEKTQKYLLDTKGNKIPLLDEEGKIQKYLTFKKGSVFDISQTNAKEIGAWKDLDVLPADAGIDEELFNRIKSVIEDEYLFDITCEPITDHGPNPPQGYCIPNKGKIHISSDLSYTAQLSVLFHEVGHAIMHNDHALKNRDKESIRYEDIHTAETKDIELEAEAFAYALSHSCGIKPPSELYLLSWQGNKSDQAKEELTERLEYLSKTITEFSQKVNLKEIMYEFNYQKSYPLHYKYSSIKSIEEIDLEDFKDVDLSKIDNNACSLEKLINDQLSIKSPGLSVPEEKRFDIKNYLIEHTSTIQAVDSIVNAPIPDRLGLTAEEKLNISYYKKDALTSAISKEKEMARQIEM